MTRTLGVDHGDARVGLALSDELNMFAHPLETVHVQQTEPVQRIAEVVDSRRVGTVVVGMPYRMDGTEGRAAEKVREFIAELRKRLPPQVEIAEVDERLTTVTAQGHLHASGRKTRDSRPVIDQAAATVILQDYLDSKQGIPLLPDEEE